MTMVGVEGVITNQPPRLTLLDRKKAKPKEILQQQSPKSMSRIQSPVEQPRCDCLQSILPPILACRIRRLLGTPSREGRTSVCSRAVVCGGSKTAGYTERSPRCIPQFYSQPQRRFGRETGAAAAAAPCARGHGRYHDTAGRQQNCCKACRDKPGQLDILQLRVQRRPHEDWLRHFLQECASK